MSVTINGTTGITTPNVTAADSSSKIPGEIFKFAGSTPPAGCLSCPTSQFNISRTAYSNLFAAIGTTWGVGDGSTTFGIPYFPLGYSAVSLSPGQSSNGAVISHNHIFYKDTYGPGYCGCATIVTGVYPNTYNSVATSTSGAASNFAAGIGVQFCVKY